MTMKLSQWLSLLLVEELDIRFIETMPIGLAGIEAVDRHFSEKDILERVFKRLWG